MNSSGPTAKKGISKSPWCIEVVVFFLVLWQESVRLELRTASKGLRIPTGLQQFYYYNFGDFSNGFVNAFLIDGIVDLLILGLRRKSKADTSSRVPTPQVRALVASAISMVIIIAFELRSTALNNADLADIPAGIAGALVYGSVRCGAIAYRNRER